MVRIFDSGGWMDETREADLSGTVENSPKDGTILRFWKRLVLLLRRIRIMTVWIETLEIPQAPVAVAHPQTMAQKTMKTTKRTTDRTSLSSTNPP